MLFREASAFFLRMNDKNRIERNKAFFYSMILRTFPTATIRSSSRNADRPSRSERSNPCRENRRDFADFQKNRRKLVVNRIWY